MSTQTFNVQTYVIMTMMMIFNYRLIEAHCNLNNVRLQVCIIIYFWEYIKNLGWKCIKNWIQTKINFLPGKEDKKIRNLLQVFKKFKNHSS